MLFLSRNKTFIVSDILSVVPDLSGTGVVVHGLLYVLWSATGQLNTGGGGGLHLAGQNR